MSQAEALFAKFLADFADVERPPSAEFEALCAAHPSLSNALRQLKSDRDRVRPHAERTGRGARIDSRASAPLSERLRAQFGQDVDPGVALGGKAPEPDSGPSSELLERLRAHAPSSSRYQLLGEVGRGGMGAVLRIWDEDLRRTLAMKVVLGREHATTADDTPSVDPKTLGRFLEEAQITGQLDHPGIVPVHELGLGSDGRVYFTMRLVKGEDLRKILDHVRTGHDGWNPTRALSVLLKVCEAMSYAHDKGVIHRDLKPANVMVGKYGEVYVMDWGLARVLGQKDQHDVRVKPQPASSASVRTERRSERDETPDSPLVTMDGDVVGTPAYMAPEQARGDLPALGPRSDVYAVGALLYHLIAGEPPYMPRDARVNQYAIWQRVQEGPPRPLTELAPRAPAELVSICEKAMQRDASKRYGDMPALAEDLRAYLERRVVKAYESGTWAETRKWVQRNKPLAAAVAGAAVIAVSSLVWIGAKNAELDTARIEANQRAELASLLKDQAIAREREGRLRGLISKLAFFETLDDDVYAFARKQARPATEWWLKGARELVDGVTGPLRPREDPDSSSSYPGSIGIAAGIVRGVPADAPEPEWQPGLAAVRGELEKVRSLAKRRNPEQAQPNTELQFRNYEDGWWYAELVKLEAGLERLSKQIEYARASVADPEAQSAWREAIEQIARSEKYRGTKWPSGDTLTPQLGLLPIGPDPNSGLWEFAHLATGRPARRGADKKLILEPEMGLVLVLLPSGKVPVANSAGQSQIAALTRVDLDAFFLSKYEMTAAQWARIEGWRRTQAETPATLMPATEPSWDDCQVALSRNAGWLQLPTEAQWEYGCRATTSTMWWTGDDVETLKGAERLQVRNEYQSATAVGLLKSNAFGLHDVHGNVWEWCRDAFGRGEDDERRIGDGLYDEEGAVDRVVRGGSFWLKPEDAGSSSRSGNSPGYRFDAYGLRPARGVTP